MTPLIQKIVVPVDFSESCQRATSYAAALARRLDASVHLIHVLPPSTVVTGPLEFYGGDGSEVRERMQQNARARLAAIATGLQHDTNRIMTEVRTGPTTQSINQAVIDYGADLVIMGTHGRSGLSHLLLGSVAEGVMRTAACPVLVVRALGGVQTQPLRAAESIEMA